MIVQAFTKFPAEAAIIGRLLAGYGELEFALALCVDRATRKFDPNAVPYKADARHLGIKALYRLRSESSRLEVADALMRADYVEMGLEDDYAEALGGIRLCLKIRNQYAHCHWADFRYRDGYGLFFTALEDAAETSGSFPFLWNWRGVSLDLLTDQEAYFSYALQMLKFIWGEFRVRKGMARAHDQPRPSKIPQPRRYIPPEELEPPDPDSSP